MHAGGEYHLSMIDSDEEISGAQIQMTSEDTTQILLVAYISLESRKTWVGENFLDILLCFEQQNIFVIDVPD